MTGTTPSSTAARLGFGLLGPLRVTRSDLPLALGGRQQRAVLARLLVDANTVVSIDRLVDAVWGERAPGGSVTTLQTYLSHLRDALEVDRVRGSTGLVLVTEPGGYRLQADGSAIDAVVFEQRARAGRRLLQAGQFADASAELTAALGLWRGPVLADLADYDFARVAASRLEELRVGAIEARVEADLALGRHHEVVGELDELVAAYPLRERLHAQRMLALYRCGRQSDALAGYQQLRATLVEELGIDPSPPLQQQYRAILAQDPALDWQPAAAPSTAEGRVDEFGGNDRVVGRKGRRPRWVRPVAAVGAAVLVAAGVWIVVANHSGPATLSALPANTVGSLDAHGAMRAAVGVGQSPDGLAYGDGSLWVTNPSNHTVSRIDPATRAVVQRIPVGADPNAAVVTGEDVWVVNGGDGTVSRINTQSDSVVQQINVGNLPDAIAAGPSGVWVALSGDAAVRRIDPVSGQLGPPIPVGGQPDGIGVGQHTVWVANGADGTVSRIDPATGQVGSPVFVGTGPKGIAVTPNAVWVTNALVISSAPNGVHHVYRGPFERRRRRVI